MVVCVLNAFSNYNKSIGKKLEYNLTYQVYLACAMGNFASLNVLNYLKIFRAYPILFQKTFKQICRSTFKQNINFDENFE